MIRLSGLVNLQPLKEEEKWIQQAIKKPGALHKQLGVPADEKIPAGELKAAAKKGGKLGQRARLAITLRKLKEEQTLSEEQIKKVDELLEKLDPVGQEDADINNDGKVDGSDKYLHNRRKAIGKAMAMHEDVNGAVDNMDSERVDDHEGSMAKADLLSIHKKAGELYNMIGEDEELEGWVQAKITKAAEYITSVHNNMEYEKSKPATIGNGEMAPADKNLSQMAESVEPLEEKAPEGWEATVKRMKKHKEIDNPWALAHWMKSRGYHPHAKKGKKE